MNESAPIQNRLRSVRSQAKLGMVSVAEMVGVDASTLSRWETHTSEVPDRSKVRLAEIYDTTVDDLFDFAVTV